MTTFRRRLTVALAASTAAFLSVFCLLLYFWCKSAFLVDLDGDLEAICRADFADNGEIREHSHQSSEPSEFGEYKVFKLLVGLDGKVLESTQDGTQPLPVLPPETLDETIRKGGAFGDFEYEGDLYRILSLPVVAGSSTVIEIHGISEEPMLESLEELRHALAVSLAIGILLIALVSDRVAAFLTRPLEGMLNQLESVTSQGDPSMRLTGTYQDAEIVSLQREVNAMLERLDQSFQAQKEFVSNASHELRAPLANLSLAIEVCLRRPRSDQEYLEALQTCHGEARRLTEMADQLLTLSRADENALVKNLEPIELKQFLSECVARKEAAAKENGVYLEIVGEAAEAPADSFKLTQVIDNLLDNALRYSKPGTSVTVKVNKDTHSALISVTDQGQGMTPQQLERVFERFFRADPSRQRGTGGAGLGLAISRAIVEAHGGTLSAKSTPGEGSTFTVRLPLG